MNRNLLGELRIMKDYGIKPNYSALQREYGIDRHTALQSCLHQYEFSQKSGRTQIPSYGDLGQHKEP